MIDDKDRKIIDALTDNSRQSFREIAKKIGLSTVTVMKRVKRLEKERVIQSYTLKADYYKLGYDIDVMISVKVSQGKYGMLSSSFINNPNILAIYDLTGEFDAVIIAKLKNKHALDKFLKKLQTYPVVERTQTAFILRSDEKNGIKLSGL